MINPVDEGLMRDALRQEEMRKEDERAAWMGFYGLFPDTIKHEKDEPNDNIKANKIKPVVNASVNFLFGTPPAFEIPKEGVGDGQTGEEEGQDNPPPPPSSPDDKGEGGIPIKVNKRPKPKRNGTASSRRGGDGEHSSDDSPLEKWIDEGLRQNNWEALLLDEGINGAVCGTVYMRLDPPEEGEEYPHLTDLNPTSMRIKTHPRYHKKVTAYIWEHTSHDPDTRRPIFYRQRTELQDVPDFDAMTGEMIPPTKQKWVIIDEHSFTMGSGWVEDSKVDWPYSWPPIIHCKNLPNPNSPYGEPDVTPTLLEGNHALNFNRSNRRKIDRHHGHPVIWMTGHSGDLSKIKFAVGSILKIPSKDVNVGQFVPAVDGSASSQLGKEIYEDILEESGTPSIVLGKPDDGGDPSGVALRVKLWPLLQKTETKRKLYGPWIVEIIRRFCELGGKGSDVVVELSWPELIPTDPMEERNALKADKDMGIASLQTISEKLDYDYETEQENMNNEAEVATSRMAERNDALGIQPVVPGQIGKDGKPRSDQPNGPVPAGGGSAAVREDYKDARADYRVSSMWGGYQDRSERAGEGGIGAGAGGDIRPLPGITSYPNDTRRRTLLMPTACFRWV
jgi:hypothetical protein